MVFCSSLILPISCYKGDLNKQDFYSECDSLHQLMRINLDVYQLLSTL